jgi:hypothetical protein
MSFSMWCFLRYLSQRNGPQVSDQICCSLIAKDLPTRLGVMNNRVVDMNNEYIVKRRCIRAVIKYIFALLELWDDHIVFDCFNGPSKAMLDRSLRTKTAGYLKSTSPDLKTQGVSLKSITTTKHVSVVKRKVNYSLRPITKKQLRQKTPSSFSTDIAGTLHSTPHNRVNTV